MIPVHRHADALHAQGFAVRPEHIELEAPIRTLDNRVITIRFTEEVTTQVKLWVVKEGGADHDDEPDQRDEQPADNFETERP